MSTTGALQRGDLVPHFSVRSVNGETVKYSTIWQTEQLVLIALPASHSPAVDVEAYARALSGHTDQFQASQTRCVVTRDPVPGLPAPGALVADRWGEIAYVTHVTDVSELPSARELVEWIEYVQSKCPECEGEAH